MNTTNRQHTSSPRPVQRLDGGRGGKPRLRNQQEIGDSVLDSDDNEGDYNDVWPPPMPNSAVRYDRGASLPGNTRYQFHPDQMQRIPRRTSAPQEPPIQTGRATTEEQRRAAPARKRRGGWFHLHPLLWLGVGMLLMLGLWQGLTMLGNWWTLHQQDATYGRPRTAQYDEVVGHNHDSPTNPTHFIALNLNSTVVVIEIPGGDTSKSKIYQGPHLYGPDADLDPVTLSFRDVNGDGTLDMIVTVQGAEIVFLNQNGQFVMQPSH